MRGDVAVLAGVVALAAFVGVAAAGPPYVTLTAWSEDGHQQSDTLYVNVNPFNPRTGNSGASGADTSDGCFVSYEPGGDNDNPMSTGV